MHCSKQLLDLMSDMRGTVTEGQDTVRGQHPLQRPCQVPVATCAISPCVLWPEKYHSEAAVKGDGDGADAQRVYCYRSIDRMSSQTVLCADTELQLGFQGYLPTAATISQQPATVLPQLLQKHSRQCSTYWPPLFSLVQCCVGVGKPHSPHQSACKRVKDLLLG